MRVSSLKYNFLHNGKVNLGTFGRNIKERQKRSAVIYSRVRAVGVHLHVLGKGGLCSQIQYRYIS